MGGVHIARRRTAVSGMKKTNLTRSACAVAVLKSATVVEHLPRKISTLYSLFIRRGGAIRCQDYCLVFNTELVLKI